MPRGDGPLTSYDVDRADAALTAALVRDFDEARRLAGGMLACQRGCSECCLSPFPITRLDVRRLRKGLAILRREQPDAAERLVRRAAEAATRLTPGYPGDATHGRLDADETALDRFFARHAGLACPALEPASGRCELYAWRPVSCRTYGPPLAFGEEKASHCRLCFVGADEATVERCRVEPDAAGREQAILAALGVREGSEWETLIAFALAAEDGTQV